MSANPITTLIALLMCVLIAFGFYSFNDNALKEILCGGSFLLLFTTLFFVIGARFAYYQQSINVRTVSAIFFALFLASNLLFSFLSFTQGAYIVVHGIAFLMYLLILYFITNPAKSI